MKRLLSLLVAGVVLVGCSSGGGTANSTDTTSKDSGSEESSSTETVEKAATTSSKDTFNYEDGKYYDEEGNEVEYQYYWTASELGNLAPKPDEQYMVMPGGRDSDECYDFHILNKPTVDYANTYIEQCKTMGYTNVESVNYNTGWFIAYDEAGNQIHVEFMDASNYSQYECDFILVSVESAAYIEELDSLFEDEEDE